jgi:hypothetical protein
MRSTDSKVADLLPRVVGRPARRTDEKEEELWVKPVMRPAGDDPAGRKFAHSAVFVVLPVLILASTVSFAATNLVALDRYTFADDASGRSSLARRGSPLVVQLELNCVGIAERRFSPVILVLNGVFWAAVAMSIAGCLYGSLVWLIAGVNRRRRFTLGHLVALTVGVALGMGAWRFESDRSLERPDLSQTVKAFEQGRAAGPFIQPMARCCLPAAIYAYVGIGCFGAASVLYSLGIVRQFLPRRAGEDKPLLQQIF